MRRLIAPAVWAVVIAWLLAWAFWNAAIPAFGADLRVTKLRVFPKIPPTPANGMCADVGMAMEDVIKSCGSPQARLTGSDPFGGTWTYPNVVVWFSHGKAVGVRPTK